MLRTTGIDSRRLQLSFAVLFVLAAAFPGATLFSGQVIKQFESYSLAQSMATGGWNPYATTIPCAGGIRWVLELPLFVGLGGIFVRLFPDWPSILPILIYGAFLLGLYRLRERLVPESSWLGWTAVAAAPVFLRFSTQFLADPLAVTLVLFGVVSFLEDRRALSVLYFLVAVSVKPTVLPSIVFFRWAFATERGPRKFLPPNAARWLAREAAIAIACVAPFVAWTLSVKWLGIPSPMHEGGLLAIGSDWAILADPKFYSKFLNWTIFKGVGIPLFGLAVYGVVRAWRDTDGAGSDRTLRLAAWSIGIFPYWLLIRRLNFIHDYYSLSFFLPIAVLGATTSLGANRWARLFLVVSIVQGVGTFVASGISVPWKPRVSERPVFCGKEFSPLDLSSFPAVK